MALVWFSGIDEMANGQSDFERFFSLPNQNVLVRGSGGAFGGKRIDFTGASILVPRIGPSAGFANFAAAWGRPSNWTTTTDSGRCGFAWDSRSGVFANSKGWVGLILSGAWVVQRTFSSFGDLFWMEVGFMGGALLVYINGILRLSHTMPPQDLHLGRSWVGSGSPGVSMDDLIFWNDIDNGDGFHTLPIGPQRIQTLENRAPGNSAQWTPNAGANWEAVNAGGWAGGAGVEASTTGLIDRHLIDPPAWNSARFRALQQRISGESLSETLGAARMHGSIGGDSYVTDPHALPYNQAEVIMGPVIPGPFEPAEFTTAQFGYESA